MEDREIIELYWQRDENAIRETDSRYGSYLLAVARNILNDQEDSKEAVNDTYGHDAGDEALITLSLCFAKACKATKQSADSIPPQRPNAFLVWLSRITRSLAIDRLRFLTRKIRGSSQYDVSLEEIGECIGERSSEKEYDLSLLKDAISSFLRRFPQKQRNLFLCRYFYFDSLKEAAAACGFSESGAKTQLFRMRAALKEYLETEGFLS